MLGAALAKEPRHRPLHRISRSEAATWNLHGDQQLWSASFWAVQHRVVTEDEEQAPISEFFDWSFGFPELRRLVAWDSERTRAESAQVPVFDSQQLWLACHLRETFFEHAAPSTHSDGHPQMPSPSLALFRGSSDALWHWRPHLMHWSGWTDTSCAPQVLQLPGLPPRSVCRCETAKLGPLLGCPVVEGRSERSRASLTPKPFSKRRRPSNEPQLATIPLLPDPG